MDSMMNDLYAADEFVNVIYSLLSGGLGVVAMLGTIITMAVTFLLTVAQWILLALPLFALAKKTGRKLGWIAWIPVLGDYCRMFTLSDIPGDKEFVLFGKLRIKSRFLTFWIWAGIALFGSLVWDVAMSLITAFFPIGAMLTVLLSLVPDVALGFVEYVFLRDVLDMFKPDKKANSTWAIVATVVDAILPWRFVTTICLFMLMKCEPLPQIEQNKTVVEGTMVR